MALVTIKDLPQSDDLDREAMRSIVGGGSAGAWPIPIDQAESARGRIVEYPPGFSRIGSSQRGLNTGRDKPRPHRRSAGSFDEKLF